MKSGKLKTSTILVARGNKTQFFRTIGEMPFALRRKIARMASEENTGTLLIADRRGAQEWLAEQGRRPDAAPPARRRWWVWAGGIVALLGALGAAAWGLGSLRW